MPQFYSNLGNWCSTPKSNVCANHGGREATEYGKEEYTDSSCVSNVCADGVGGWGR